MSQVHWESIHTGRSPTEQAWFEPVPSTLALVRAHSRPSDSVIDVGGGASTLALELMRAMYHDVTVLDISKQALAQSRSALWQHTASMHWIHGDVCEFRPDRRWRVWHDRAVFHFLVDPADRDAYRAALDAAVAPDGVIIVSTFSPDGPERCAGLPVRRYDVASLAAEFAPAFQLIEGHELTPSSGGDQRPYVAVVMRRTSN